MKLKRRRVRPEGFMKCEVEKEKFEDIQLYQAVVVSMNYTAL